ncbi:hypothetical protein [Haloferax sulfurifontis]|uniref:Uncharacterized protein n=1 Tax=Haloferax sulfurifontis TaxID=255616 RepID=A0A830DYF3_9EURY|nr:hypothetical protein [Haloferax sulfurifontis]GGC52998.1 hypothetical protein GCM10007209_13390 [Haloferax sulfurifontis]
MVDTNGTSTWGDGSNNWLGGIGDFVSDPGQAVRDPADTVAGAADAAALNFDEGVGGLISLFDDDAGNTAGPGQSPWIEDPVDGQPSNPTRGTGLADAVWIGVLLVGGLVVLYLVRPLLEIVAGVVNDE